MAAEPLPHDPHLHDRDLPASPDDAGRADRATLWGASTPPAAGARRADRQGRVVQSMAHKVTRPCRRNACPAPARASMVLDYAGKQVTLVPLLDVRDPRFLELCPSHATSLEVPRGWDLVDERDEEPEAPTGPPSAAEMGSSATVAVLAAALRDPAPAPAPAEDRAALQPVAAAPVDSVDVDPVDVDSVDVDPVDVEVGVDDEPDPAPVRPTTPSGRLARPRAVPTPVDRRQLVLGNPDDQAAAAPMAPGVDVVDDRPHPRQVPAARPPERAEDHPERA